MSLESLKLKIHIDFKKLQNLYNELLNTLFPIVENKPELERLIIEEVTELNEFETLVFDFLDLNITIPIEESFDRMRDLRILAFDRLINVTGIAETQINTRQINGNQSIKNNFNKEIIKANKIMYKIIKLLCIYSFDVLSALVLLIPSTQTELEEILQEQVDFLNQNIQEFEIIGLFKFANKLIRFRDKFIIKFRNFFGLN